MRVNVGDYAKDTVTGFEGIVIARTEWLNGCARVVIQPNKLKEGKMVQAETVDEMQCTVIKGKGWKEPRQTSTGGPRPDPVRHASPER